jgi:hypothetical protein
MSKLSRIWLCLGGIDMDVSEKYKRIAVKISCNGREGSGCLLATHSNNNVCYVITASHVLGNDIGEIKKLVPEQIVVKQFEATEEAVPIGIVDFFIHPSIDFAVIQVVQILDIPCTILAKPAYKTDVSLYGYPHFISAQQKIDCAISYCADSETEFELTTKVGQHTFGFNAADTIQGLSGSGIFFEDDAELVLVGIFTGLKAPDGAYQGLVGVKITCINDIFNRCGHSAMQIREQCSLRLGAFQGSIDKEPLVFYDEDIRDIILFFAQESEALINIVDPPHEPNIERKNEINKLTKEYFHHINDSHLVHFGKIRGFLVDPKNINYLNMYKATTEELRFKITANRDKFGNFDQVFIHLHDYILKHNLSALKTNRALIWVFLHYMYWDCEIGERP